MDHRPRRRRRRHRGRRCLDAQCSMLISIIVKITAQCTSILLTTASGYRCWWRYPRAPRPRSKPGHSQPSMARGGPKETLKLSEKKPKQNKTGRLHWTLFIVSVNSEACLNSEMNLWINTIMVIWHPLWLPLRVFVCPPAAFAALATRSRANILNRASFHLIYVDVYVGVLFKLDLVI